VSPLQAYRGRDARREQAYPEVPTTSSLGERGIEQKQDRTNDWHAPAPRFYKAFLVPWFEGAVRISDV
jgi:hypothetical protein